MSGSARLSALLFAVLVVPLCEATTQTLSRCADPACGCGAARRRRARPRSQPARASAHQPTTTAAGMVAARAAGARGAASGSSGSSCSLGRCADRGHLGCCALPAAARELCRRRLTVSTLHFAFGVGGLCCADTACMLWCVLLFHHNSQTVLSSATGRVAQAAALCPHRCAFQPRLSSTTTAVTKARRLAGGGGGGDVEHHTVGGAASARPAAAAQAAAGGPGCGV